MNVYVRKKKKVPASGCLSFPLLVLLLLVPSWRLARRLGDFVAGVASALAELWHADGGSVQRRDRERRRRHIQLALLSVGRFLLLAGGAVVKAAFDEYHKAGNELDGLSPAARHIVEKCLEGAHNGTPDCLQDSKGSKSVELPFTFLWNQTTPFLWML